MTKEEESEPGSSTTKSIGSGETAVLVEHTIRQQAEASESGSDDGGATAEPALAPDSGELEEEDEGEAGDEVADVLLQLQKALVLEEEQVEAAAPSKLSSYDLEGVAELIMNGGCILVGASGWPMCPHACCHSKHEY